MSVATKYTRSLKEATDFFVLAEMLYISPKKLNYIVQKFIPKYVHYANVHSRSCAS